MSNPFPLSRRAGRGPGARSGQRLFLVGMLTVVATLGVNLLVRALVLAVLPISPAFRPLQVGPRSRVTVLLVGSGVLVYAWVTRGARHPAGTFTVISLLALLLSLVPPALLLLNPDPRIFPGITGLAVGILMGFHLMDTGITLLLLLVLAPAQARVIQGKKDTQ